VVGFKPTYGRVSRYGVVPLAWSLDHVGIFARTVEDVGLLFEALDGHDPGDPGSAPGPGPGPLRGDLGRPPRLGWVTGAFVERATPEVRNHLAEVARRLSGAGATIEEIRLPEWLPSVLAATNLIVRAEAAAYHAERHDRHADNYRPRIRAAIEAGMLIPATAYLRAQRIRRQFRREISAFFSRADALVTPVATSPAPDLSTTGDPTFCAPWSFAGLPALALPSGLSRDGLPLGIQLVGPALQDAGLLAVSRWCETALQVALVPPPLT
jgi:Asp-tRNA(Asn)/Glu-tRNA(Gln) amidotransferase A subunit family amidase